MSIDFATLQGLTIPEGVVTQIADASGRVLWSAVRMVEDRAVLTVAKQTATTYVGETSYANESFILLDIYPVSGGTVNVTYGNLTKTITDTSGAEKPNAQQVYFGTFNGVTDSVTTPDSGTLTIEGNFYAYGCGTYQSSSKSYSVGYAKCVTDIIEFGEYVTEIPSSAFAQCSGITNLDIPDSVTNIGSYAFYQCTNIALTSLPSNVATIGGHAFGECEGITLTSLPSGITSIGDYAFSKCFGISEITIPSSVVSIGQCVFLNVAINTIISYSSAVPVINGCLVDLANKTLITGSVNSVIPADGSVEIIDLSAFSNVTFPANHTIPASVTNIKNYAFTPLQSSNCPGYLKNVVVLATTPPTLDSNVFGNLNYGTWGETFVITVPAGYGETYKAATGWSTYADHITEAS